MVWSHKNPVKLPLLPGDFLSLFLLLSLVTLASLPLVTQTDKS